MNYIARNVPTAPPLPGGRPPASVLLRGKRRASGRCARQARGRRDLGQPVGDVQVAGPGRACTRAARGTGRGGSAHRRSDAAGRRAARPRVGVPADGRARPRRRGPDRRGRNTGVPRHLQRPAQGLLRPAASGCAGREGGRADRDGARRGAFAGARSRAAPAVRERRRDGHRARRLCHERAVRRRDAGRRAARGRRPRGAGGGRAGERRQRLIIEEGDFTVSATTERPIAIYYEHPDWFRPLFLELDRRRVPYVRVDAADHRFDAGDGRPPYSLVFNRMSPSAYLRGHGNAIFYTLHYLAYLKRHDVRVINGYDAYVTETSKALQLSLLHHLGLPYPRARVINHPARAPEAAQGFRFPVIVKPNIGGSGAGIRRFETPEQLEQATRATGDSTSTTSTRSRTSWPTRRASWGSIRSRGSSTTSSGQLSDHALRLLAPRVRRLAPQRARRGHGSELGVRASPGTAQRSDRLRRHPDRRAQPERHQGSGRARARRLDHDGGTRRGH